MMCFNEKPKIIHIYGTTLCKIGKTTHCHDFRTIWLSMGLCYDENLQIRGKGKYPYTEITPLSVKLWKHFFPEVRIWFISTRKFNGDHFWRNCGSDRGDHC